MKSIINKINSLIGVLTLVLIVTQGNAQSPILNNYIYNPSAYNVAYTGARRTGEFFVNYRKQWLSMPNAPWYLQATLGVPLLKSKNLSAGVNVLHQKAFILSNTSALANLAYHLPLGKEEDGQFLSAGMGIGLQTQNINALLATPYTVEDPNYVKTISSGSQINFSLGLLYQIKGFELGFSIPHSFGTTVETFNAQNNTIAFRNSADMLFNTAYNISMGKEFYLKPEVILHMTTHEPMQFLGNLTLNYKNTFFFGGGMRSGNSNTLNAFNVTFGIQIQKSVRCAYTFEQANHQSQSLGSTHDIMIGMQWGQQIEDLQEQTNDLEAERTANRRKIDSLTRKVTSLNSQLALLQSNSDSMNQEFKELQLKAEQTQSDIDFLLLKNRNKYGLASSYYLQNATKLGMIYFAQDKYNIGTDAEFQLIAMIDKIKKMPKTQHIYVISSTSPEGTTTYNTKLATQRAVAVRDFITRQGLDRHRITIIPVGAANVVPIDYNEAYSEASKRRVEVWVMED